MGSKRAIRRKACTGKIRYSTREKARARVFKTSFDGRSLDVYKCEFCGGWHIGHTMRRF